MADKEKQIEEMAKIIARRSTAFRNPSVAFMTTAEKTAQSLCNAGYRKQSEGEWIKDSLVDDTVICSLCGYTDHRFDYDRDEFGSKFCPNCGAKMKGGEE